MTKNPDNNAEQKLISETLRGNADAFRPLVEKYWGLVSSIMQKYIRNRETAADLCQEAFLSAFSRLSQYRSQQKFSPWLARIAINKAFEHLRRESRTQYVDCDLDLAASSLLPPETVVDQQLFFDSCLESLPEKLQVLFILRHGLDFSYEEMAYVLDLPVGTVKSIMFRIRSQLKVFLENQARSDLVLCSGEQESDRE